MSIKNQRRSRVLLFFYVTWWKKIVIVLLFHYHEKVDANKNYQICSEIFNEIIKENRTIPIRVVINFSRQVRASYLVFKQRYWAMQKKKN